jgi:hypothetical protein
MAEAPPAEPEKEEEDDVSLPVPEGARCKRRACGAAWEGEGVSRGDGEKAKCRYHPMGVRISHLHCNMNSWYSRYSTREQSTMLVVLNAKCSSLTNL